MLGEHLTLFTQLMTTSTYFPLNRYNQQRIIPLEGISIEKIEDYEGTTQINGWTIRVIIDQELKSIFFHYAYAKSVDFQ